MDIWKQIQQGFYNLGQIIENGGEDMSTRIEKEFYELGALIAEAKEAELRTEKKE